MQQPACRAHAGPSPLPTPLHHVFPWKMTTPLPLLTVVAVDPGIASVGLACAQVAWDASGWSLRAMALAPRPPWVRNITDARSEVRGVVHVHDYLHAFLSGPDGDLLRSAAVVVVEAQAPGCAGQPLDIMLRERLGASCAFVAPARLLAHHGTAHLDYDGRKKASVDMAKRLLGAGGAWGNLPGARDALAALEAMPRAHDASDAVLMLLWFIDGGGWRVKPPQPRPLPPARAACMDCWRFTASSAGFAALSTSMRRRQQVSPAPLTSRSAACAHGPGFESGETETGTVTGTADGGACGCGSPPSDLPR